MVQNEIQERIDELKRQIDSLPSGTVSTKKSREKSIIITVSALTAKEGKLCSGGRSRRTD